MPAYDRGASPNARRKRGDPQPDQTDFSTVRPASIVEAFVPAQVVSLQQIPTESTTNAIARRLELSLGIFESRLDAAVVLVDVTAREYADDPFSCAALVLVRPHDRVELLI